MIAPFLCEIFLGYKKQNKITKHTMCNELCAPFCFCVLLRAGVYPDVGRMVQKELNSITERTSVRRNRRSIVILPLVT